MPGPVPGRGPAVEKHCSRAKSLVGWTFRRGKGSDIPSLQLTEGHLDYGGGERSFWTKASVLGKKDDHASMLLCKHIPEFTLQQ